MAGVLFGSTICRLAQGPTFGKKKVRAIIREAYGEAGSERKESESVKLRTAIEIGNAAMHYIHAVGAIAKPRLRRVQRTRLW